jgi:hypothetical protein
LDCVTVTLVLPEPAVVKFTVVGLSTTDPGSTTEIGNEAERPFPPLKLALHDPEPTGVTVYFALPPELLVAATVAMDEQSSLSANLPVYFAWVAVSVLALAEPDVMKLKLDGLRTTPPGNATEIGSDAVFPFPPVKVALHEPAPTGVTEYFALPPALLVAATVAIDEQSSLSPNAPLYLPWVTAAVLALDAPVVVKLRFAGWTTTLPGSPTEIGSDDDWPPPPVKVALHDPAPTGVTV